MFPYLINHLLGKQLPENCPKWNSKVCASASAVSSPDGKKPQDCGDTNGQELTFDCTVLYPFLWISDSKRPHPRGLMCSAWLQALTESRWSEKYDMTIESYHDNIQCWNSSLKLESFEIWKTSVSHLVPTEHSEMSQIFIRWIKMRLFIKGTKTQHSIFCMWSHMSYSL